MRHKWDCNGRIGAHLPILNKEKLLRVKGIHAAAIMCFLSRLSVLIGLFFLFVLLLVFVFTVALALAFVLVLWLLKTFRQPCMAQNPVSLLVGKRLGHLPDRVVPNLEGLGESIPNYCNNVLVYWAASHLQPFGMSNRRGD